MKHFPSILVLSLLLAACAGDETRPSAPTARQAAAAPVSASDRETIRILTECGHYYATLAGIGSRSNNPHLTAGARERSNRFGALAGGHARARGIPFPAFQRISDQSEASIRTQRRDIDRLIDTYSDYCEQIGEANGIG